MKKRYKPKAIHWLIAAYWWNPFFWAILILLPFAIGIVEGIKGFVLQVKEIKEDLKEWDLN
jgi:hypothetical protein